MESKEGPRQVDAVPGLSLFATGIDIARLFEGNAPLVLGSFLLFGLLLISQGMARALTSCAL